MISKAPRESLTITTDFILPGQTNQMNNLFGGELLSMLDRIAYISACRHSERQGVVTVAVNNVSFQQSIPLGSMLTLEAMVSRAFNSSMEVIIEVWIEDLEKKTKVKSNEAMYTFVALDEHGIPVEVPTIKPETSLDRQRYDAALRRRQLSLLLAGRISVSEATELNNLFTQHSYKKKNE